VSATTAFVHAQPYGDAAGAIRQTPAATTAGA